MAKKNVAGIHQQKNSNCGEPVSNLLPLSATPAMTGPPGRKYEFSQTLLSDDANQRGYQPGTGKK